MKELKRWAWARLQKAEDLSTRSRSLGRQVTHAHEGSEESGSRIAMLMAIPTAIISEPLLFTSPMLISLVTSCH